MKSNRHVVNYMAWFEHYRYTWFDGNKPFNLNIFGVRTKDRQPDVFDDFIFCVFRDVNQRWIIRQWEATTDPGLYWLHRPANVEGTALLVPGQYRSAYRIDYHQGKYLALCQRRGPVRVYRDDDRDGRYDLHPERIQEGFFGINIHKAATATERVGKWSAGCQVFKYAAHFDDFMRLCKTAARLYGNAFTYTLFDERDLISNDLA